jgi:hypothetical protein
MKNEKAISTLVCITLLAAMMLFTRQVLAIDVDALAGLWLFDEGSGEVAGDSSGNGHDGTIIGDPNWVKGKFGEALEFDGVDDLVDTLYTADDQNEAYTVMCWVKLSGKSPHTSHRLLAGRSNGTPQLWVANTGRALAQHKTSSDFQGAEGTTDIPEEEWVHLAGTFDGTTVSVYVNGEEQNRFKPTAPPIENIYTVQMGGFDDILHGGSWSGCWTNAAIDEVALFSVLLTENEVKSIMQNGLEVTVLAVFPADKLADTWGRIKKDIVKYLGRMD